MRTRFAPSPTGPLHLGHAYSAMYANDLARNSHGEFLLRIEDIDRSRSRDCWRAQIFDDLAWLGLSWPEPVLLQSERLEVYASQLERLWTAGLLYPCTCRRRDILNALDAPQEGVAPTGPDGPVYPGTCRPSSPPTGSMPRDTALRLDMRRALQHIDLKSLWFDDQVQGRVTLDADALIEEVGDIALARRDMGTSYHLSVVVDDAEQGITDVVRGEDLFDATAIHVVLQRLLALPLPRYHHHRLIRDAAGKRLAKRDDARAIARYREDGLSPNDIRTIVGLPN